LPAGKSQINHHARQITRNRHKKIDLATGWRPVDVGCLGYFYVLFEIKI
jgi:hypothetical protein